MIIEVKVKPRASGNRISKRDDGILEVYTTKPACDGEANRAVIDMLSERFSVAKSRISIIKGQRSRIKTVEIL
jgi:hypothetical protein